MHFLLHWPRLKSWLMYSRLSLHLLLLMHNRLFLHPLQYRARLKSRSIYRWPYYRLRWTHLFRWHLHRLHFAANLTQICFWPFFYMWHRVGSYVYTSLSSMSITDDWCIYHFSRSSFNLYKTFVVERSLKWGPFGIIYPCIAFDFARLSRFILLRLFLFLLLKLREVDDSSLKVLHELLPSFQAWGVEWIGRGYLVLQASLISMISFVLLLHSFKKLLPLIIVAGVVCLLPLLFFIGKLYDVCSCRYWTLE